MWHNYLLRKNLAITGEDYDIHSTNIFEILDPMSKEKTNVI